MPRTEDLISGAAFGVTGIGIAIGAVRLGVGSVVQPGPGFMAMGLGLVLTGLSAATIVSGLRAPNSAVPLALRFPNLWVNLAVITAMLAYATVLEYAGYLVATFVLLLVLLIAAERTWHSVRAFVLAVLVTATTYFLFETLLRSGLPRGLWY